MSSRSIGDEDCETGGRSHCCPHSQGFSAGGGGSRTQRSRRYVVLNPYTIALLFFTFAIVVGPYVLNEIWHDPWSKDGYDESYTDADNCETVHMDKLLRQRANAMSNAPFLSFGFWLLLASIYDIVHKQARGHSFLPGTYANRVEWPCLLGLSTMYQGAGSFALHASSGGSELGRRMDFSGIYIIVYCIACSLLYSFWSTTLSYVAISSYTPRTDRIVSGIFVILFVIGTPFIYQYDTFLVDDDRVDDLTMYIGVIIACLAACIAMEAFFLVWVRKIPVSLPLLFLSATCFAVAMMMKVPNIFLDNCESWRVSQDSFFQLHALWHGSNALGILFISMYKRSIGDYALSKCGRDLPLNMWRFFFFARYSLVSENVFDTDKNTRKTFEVGVVKDLESV